MTYCANCGKENEDEVKFCPGCGKPMDGSKVSPTSKIEPQKLPVKNDKPSKEKRGCFGCLGMIILLIVLGAIFGGNSNDTSTATSQQNKLSVPQTTPTKIGAPDQNAFQEQLKIFKGKYNRTDGEIQKSAVYREQAAFLKTYLNSGKVTNWEGKVSELGTTEGGEFAYIKIKGDNEITYETWNNQLSDIGTGSMIKLNSKIYKDLEKLKKGDSVVFTASFIPDNKKGFYESSMTEAGYVTDPGFIVLFETISKK